MNTAQQTLRTRYTVLLNKALSASVMGTLSEEEDRAVEAELESISREYRELTASLKDA